MKKIITLLTILLFVVFMVGCENAINPTQPQTQNDNEGISLAKKGGPVAVSEGTVLVDAILNGDFSDDTPVFWPNVWQGKGSTGYNHWRMEGYHNHFPDKKWDYLRTNIRESSKGQIKHGAPEQYMEFHISGAGLDGCGIALRYIPFEGAYGDPGNPSAPASWKNVDGLQFDLTGLDPDKYYYLEADVRILAHSLKDAGWYAGSEWPVIIQLGFADANNAGRRFIWGFLDGIDTQNIRPYTQIETAKWFHYRSPELRGLWDVRPKSVTYPIDRIYGLQIRAQGHNLLTNVGDIKIVEYDSPQDITQGTGPYSSAP